MKKRIISIDVNCGSEQDYFERITKDIQNKKRGYVCFSNVHMLIEAYDDKDFATVVNSARYAFPDGFPIAKSFGILYNKKQLRIAGMDFLPNYLQVCNREGFKVAFVGSTNEILELVREKIRRELPRVEVSALISPPFGQKWDNEAYIEQINKLNTDLVFVALGCPKQERWMHQNYMHTSAMLFGIGGALPTYVGTISRAPEWMCRMGLEWLYRLYKEPRRMFKRYLYTNSKFIYLLSREIFRGKKSTDAENIDSN